MVARVSDPQADPRPAGAERILAFLAKFVALRASEEAVIREVTRIERYCKGTVLLAEGEVAGESWLVLRGCVRVFRGAGGEVHTLALHTELHLVIPPTYGTPSASPVSIECLEDVEASASTPAEEARAFDEHPAFESICRVMGDALRAHLQQAHIDAVTLTPEQRYLELVARRPDLLQRVPQYQLFLQGRAGWRIPIAVPGFWIEPAVAFNAWPIELGRPSAFREKDERWPSYFLFEPWLNFGVALPAD